MPVAAALERLDDPEDVAVDDGLDAPLPALGAVVEADGAARLEGHVPPLHRREPV